MDRQKEQKLTGLPDFGRDMPDKPFLTIGGGRITASEQPHSV